MRTLYKIEDRYYPKITKESRRRETVRGIIFNDNNEICLLHIVGEDTFGKRDHYELPGGGVENSESHEETFKREMKEELGFDVSMDKYVGTIEIEYHLLSRWDIGNFYTGHIVGYGTPHLEEYEKALFKEVVFVKADEIEGFYNSHKAQMVGDMIHERDLLAIKTALSIDKK